MCTKPAEQENILKVHIFVLKSWKEFVFVVSLTYTGIIYCTSHILLS